MNAGSRFVMGGIHDDVLYRVRPDGNLSEATVEDVSQFAAEFATEYAETARQLAKAAIERMTAKRNKWRKRAKAAKKDRAGYEATADTMANERHEYLVGLMKAFDERNATQTERDAARAQLEAVTAERDVLLNDLAALRAQLAAADRPDLDALQAGLTEETR